MFRTIEELTKVAHFGGGMILNTQGRTPDDLVKLAAAAKTHRANVVLIGAAGGGAVTFDLR